MSPQAIFILQLVLSTLVFALMARWVCGPWLSNKTQNDALFWLTLPHAFRHMGMVFLVPGVVAQPLPENFAIPAAYGDLLTGILAILTLILLKTRWKGVLAIVWLFNVVGTVDLLNALRHMEVVADLGAAWFIPSLFVPLLLVTHFMIFERLLIANRWGRTTD